MPHLGLAWCPTLRKFDRPIPVPSYVFLSIFDIPGLQTWRIDCRFWCRSRGAHGGLLRHSSWSFSSVRGRSGSGAFGQSKGDWMHSCRFQQGRCCQTNPCYAWRVSEFFHMWFESSNKGVIFLFYATSARKLIGVWMVWHFSDSSSWLEWQVEIVTAVGYQATTGDGKTEQPNAVLEALIQVVRPTGGLGIPGLYVPSDPGAPDSAAAKWVAWAVFMRQHQPFSSRGYISFPFGKDLPLFFVLCTVWESLNVFFYRKIVWERSHDRYWTV